MYVCNYLEMERDCLIGYGAAQREVPIETLI